MTERKALTYVEMDVDYCSLLYGQGACDAQLGFAGGGAPNAVELDGSNDFLERSGGLTGAADGKLLSFSLWVRIAGGNSGCVIQSVTALNGGTARTGLAFNASNELVITGYNAAGSTILSVKTSALSADGKLHHVMGSFDLTDTNKRHLYVDGASDLTVTTYTNDTLDFTMPDWGVGGRPDGSGKLNGDAADWWFAPGTYIDLSDADNRAKFLTTDKRPVDLGASGNIPTGSAPLVYLGGTYENWNENLGTGGDFTLNGGLEAASFSTGDAKCFNAPGTCQDRSHFDNDPVTLRFALATDYRPLGIDAIPSILDVDFKAGEARPGEDIGSRSSITITFREHPHPDTGDGFDKYRSERGYDPYSRGEFWSRFRARQPYLKGEPLRWIQGFLGDDLADMETRHFIVDSFDGPTPDGVFTIHASDPLRLLYGKQANVPAKSSGSLLVAINSSVTTATLTPTGIGDAEYPASGYLQIGGKEVVGFTRSGDTLTIDRAEWNTSAVAHDAGERIQLCKEFASGDPVEHQYDLFVNGAGLSASWCNLTSWQTESSSFLSRNYGGTLITEPTSVNQLATELIQQCGLNVWWDDLNQQIRVQVLRAISTDSVVYDDSSIREETFEPREQPELRKSPVWISFAQRDPLKGIEDEDNFRSHWVEPVPSTVPGNDDDYGESSVARVYSRWIPLGGGTTAQRTAQLLLGRYLTPPRRFTFKLYRSAGAATPQVGDGCLIEHRVLQDASGARERVPCQIVSVTPRPEGWDVVALEMRFTSLGGDDPTVHPLVLQGIENFDVNLRAYHDTFYPSPVGGETVNLTIFSDARLGATSTAVAALNVGTWPSLAGNGSRTSGSPILTGLADTSGFAAGMFVRGTGIPNGSKILSVDSGTQITLDQNATSSGTSTVTVYLVRIAIYQKGRIQGKGGKGGAGSNPNLGSGGGSAERGQPGLPGGPALYLRYPVDLYLDDGNAEIWGGGGGGGGGPTAHFHDADKGGGGGGGAGADPGDGGPRGTGSYSGDEAQVGQPGTLTVGGLGGYSSTRTVFWATPALRDVQDDARGGQGGGPGLPGNAGYDSGKWQNNPGAGGVAGAAIDGVSYCKKTGTGDIRGGQVN